jgi:hypothetical protein
VGELEGDGVGLTESYTQVDGGLAADAGIARAISSLASHLDAVLIIIESVFF